MNNAQVPSSWFLHRREHLETYQEELNELNQAWPRISRGQNLPALMEAVVSLNQLSENIDTMKKTIEGMSLNRLYKNDFCSENQLIRTKELASSTALHLETIAKQICWGTVPDRQIFQVSRNLLVLVKLVCGIIGWLEDRSLEVRG